MTASTHPNPSYWELDSLLGHRQIVVIGAGIVGLHTALYLKKARPAWAVTVVDRQYLYGGASTRNAGFACFGSPSELLSDLNHNTMDEVVKLVEMRWKGLRLLRQNISDAAMHFEACGGYEVFRSNDQERFEACLDSLPQFNAALDFTGSTAFSPSSPGQQDRLGLGGFKLGILCHQEGAIHPGKMMAALHRLCQKEGVEIHGGIQVNAIRNHPKRITLKFNQHYEISADICIVCTNGFSRQLLPELPITPARNQVLVTNPINNLQLKGVFHYNEGYVYFRNLGNRVLLGGARDRFKEQEETSDFGITENVRSHLMGMLEEDIIPGKDFSIDHQWSGILGTGTVKQPILQWKNDRLLIATRMGGMGVSIGAYLGQKASSLVLAS